MSIKSETRDEKFRQWKRNLDTRAQAWSESHPEADKLNTSSFFEPLTQERKLIPAGATVGVNDAEVKLNHVRFFNHGILDRMLKTRMIISVDPNKGGDGWTVKADGIPFDMYFGGDALQLAHERAREIEKIIKEA